MPFTYDSEKQRSLQPEGIAADYDDDGRLAGIEILDAVKRLGDTQIFKQVILEDIALGRLDQPQA
jgi:hypothetical protein